MDRSLIFALAGTFVLRAASYCAGIIIPIFLGIQSRSDATVTASLASLIAVTFYAAELIGAPIFGALSDRWGRKLFMLLGPIFGGVAIQMLGFTAIIPVLIVVRVLEGLSTASSAPATLGYLSAVTAKAPALRGRVMGLYEAATVVGLAAGAYIGGRLFHEYGILAFTIVAGVYVLSLLLFLPVRDVTGHAASAGHGFDLAFVRRLISGRIVRFAPAWLAANAVLGGWFAIAPFLASGRPNPDQYLMQGFRADQVGTGILAFGVTFTVGAVAWGFVMPRIGRQRTLLLGVAGLLASTVAFWFLNRLPWDADPGLVFALVAFVGVTIFVESGFTPAALAYLAEIAEESPTDRGAIMGLYSVLLSVGQLTGGLLAGPFAHRWGVDGLIGLTVILGLIATYTVLRLGATERLGGARHDATLVPD